MIPTFDRAKYLPGYVTPPLSLDLAVKDVDQKQGIVTFYGSAFGNIDSHKEIIDRGAYAKTIKEWGPRGRGRIAHLLDHNPTKRIGVPQEIMEDDHGLRVVSKLFSQDHTLARDALIEYEEGGLKEHSVGFDIVNAEPDNETNILHLTELRLYEVSAVTWGANMFTPTLDVKSLEDDPVLLEYMLVHIQKMKRVLKRGITDERAEELEAQVTAFERVFSDFKEALANRGPSSNTPDDDEPLAVGDAITELINNL